MSANYTVQIKQDATGWAGHVYYGEEYVGCCAVLAASRDVVLEKAAEMVERHKTLPPVTTEVVNL